MTGKPEPEVKWFRDEKELAPSFKVKMIKTKEAVTLTISGVTEKMSGVYKVVAINKVGQADHSAPVTVRGNSFIYLFKTSWARQCFGIFEVCRYI